MARWIYGARLRKCEDKGAKRKDPNWKRVKEGRRGSGVREGGGGGRMGERGYLQRR